MRRGNPAISFAALSSSSQANPVIITIIDNSSQSGMAQKGAPMEAQNNQVWETILSILFFPSFFQKHFVDFAWGAADPDPMMIAKRIFILLPTLAFIAACWLTIISILTIIIR